jgi:hypothetical protein
MVISQKISAHRPIKSIQAATQGATIFIFAGLVLFNLRAQGILAA